MSDISPTRLLWVPAALTVALVLPFSASAQNITYQPDPAEVTIQVEVEQIATLIVENGSGSMIIDRDGSSRMGNPASQGGGASGNMNPNNPSANYVFLRLNTNFDIGAVVGTFPTANQIRRPQAANWPDDSAVHTGAATWFGRAVGQSTSNILGVRPLAAVVDENANLVTGACDTYVTAPRDVPNPQLVRTGQQGPGCLFQNGSHRIAVGVISSWTWTQVGQPIFAEPDTYTIQLEMTLMP